MDIRQGHAQTVEKVLKFVDANKSIPSKDLEVDDLGCGTGSLTIPLLERVSLKLYKIILNLDAIETASIYILCLYT